MIVSDMVSKSVHLEVWKLIVFNTRTQKDETYFIQGSHTESRMIQILKEIHPEYEKINLVSAEMPENIKFAWGA